MTTEQIKSRIDFAKLMKDKIFDPSELISVEDVRKEVNKEKKILGPRTIEFYARYGLLKKSIRITGDKKAYYSKDYIFDALGLIFLLKSNYNMKLSKIRDFMKAIKHKPKNVFTDLMGLKDECSRREVACKDTTGRDITEGFVGEKYMDLILKNRKRSMLELIEMAEQLYAENANVLRKFEGKDITKDKVFEKAVENVFKKWESL